MPTIIDQLILELDLDPKKFEAAQSRAAAAWLKTRDAAKAGGKDIEDSSKKSADAIDRVTKSALALFGVLVGARSVKDFVVDATRTDAALGRMSTNIGMVAKDFQAWQMGSERFGGSADATASSLQAVNQQLMDLRNNGTALPTGLTRLFSDSGVTPNLTGSSQDYLLSIARATQIEAQKRGAQTAVSLLQGSGLDAGMINLMLAHGSDMQGYLGGMPQVSDQTIARLQKLQDQWAKLQQTFSTGANNVLGDFEPALEPWINDFQNLADLIVKNEPSIAAFAKDAADIANSLGEWRYAIEALVALWTGGKLLGLLGALRGLLAGGAAAEAGGGGLLGWIAGGVSAAASTTAGAALTVGGLAAGAWLASTTPAGASEDALVHKLGLGATGSHVAYLRQVAVANGLDPDKFVALANGEGLKNGVGDDKSSFGDFQLHYGGLSSQYPNAGLGEEFTAATGLDARDPSSWQAQARWVAQYISKNGAGKWSGARKLGIADSMRGTTLGSSWVPWATALSRNQSNSNSVSIGSIPITIHGGADAGKIASEIKPALKRAGITQLANYGPA